MTDLLFLTSFVLAFGLAVLVSRYARAPIAKFLLRWSSGFFFVWAFLLLVIELQCGGSLLKGVGLCRPPFLADIVNPMAGLLLLGYLAIPFLGFPLMLAGYLKELIERRYPT